MEVLLANAGLVGIHHFWGANRGGIGYFLGIGPPLFGVFAAGAICDMALALATVGIGSCMPLIGLASTLLVA